MPAILGNVIVTAALIAVSILALQDEALAGRLDAFRAKQTSDVLKAEL